jgi:hypothetical protein
VQPGGRTIPRCNDRPGDTLAPGGAGALPGTAHVPTA